MIDYKNLDIKELAKIWLDLDKNPETRATIEKLVECNDVDKLESLLRKPITFGTAGLRARMEAGFSRMNDVTVIQASQGLSHYVLSNVPDAKSRGVVIGYDHRHNSSRFAQLTALAFLSLGFKVYLYRQLVHTPLVPFGITTLNASCGIMITASHNPKEDNGYKVYWDNGCQIISPHDQGIALKISEHYQPLQWDCDSIDTNPLCSDPFNEMSIQYFEKVKLLSSFNANVSDKFNGKVPKFVYTAMHGVGGEVAKQAFKSYNLPESSFLPVPEQYEPNPDFPTVKFPNPEEKGALDLSLKFAASQDSDYVLANDPDADRFACAERLPNGEWYQFTGNQIGSILAHHMTKPFEGKDEKLALLASTVSSKMLQSMAKYHNYEFHETLSGFKWLGNQAIQLQSKNINPIFAFEEAIGYMCGDVVRDKDGISAMLMFVELATLQRSKNSTVYELLLELYYKYGVFADHNLYFIVNESDLMKKIFDIIRYDKKQPKINTNLPGEFELSYPKSVGPYQITSIRDLTIGYDTTTSDYLPTLPVSSSTQMITFNLTNPITNININLTLRTSGTEPKLKYYSEISYQFDQSQKFQKELVESKVKQLKEQVKVDVEDIIKGLISFEEFNLSF